MSGLSWRHHTLIQALMVRGPLIESEFRTIFSKLTQKPSDDNQLFHHFLKKINSNLSYVQFELRAFRNQYDGCVYYGVVNNVADEQSKLGTKYTVPQIAFYKGIIEAIVQDGTAKGSISNIDALNTRLEHQVSIGSESQEQGGSSQIPAAFRNFSLSLKERTLEELVQDKWLSTTPDGNVGLGVRSFMDLRSWFHNNDVPACNVCNEAGVKADLCSNESCNVRIHNYCLTRKFSQRQAERVCPGCGTKWNCIIPKTERVEVDTPNNSPEEQAPRKPGMRRMPKSSKSPNGDDSVGLGRKRKSSKGVDGDDSGGRGSSQTSTHTLERRATRRSARLSSASQSK